MKVEKLRVKLGGKVSPSTIYFAQFKSALLMMPQIIEKYYMSVSDCMEYFLKSTKIQQDIVVRRSFVKVTKYHL